MDRDEAIKELREFQTWGNTEAAHMEADNVLCVLLSRLGYADVVDEFLKLHKWYA